MLRKRTCGGLRWAGLQNIVLQMMGKPARQTRGTGAGGGGRACGVVETWVQARVEGVVDACPGFVGEVR